MGVQARRGSARHRGALVKSSTKGWFGLDQRETGNWRIGVLALVGHRPSPSSIGTARMVPAAELHFCRTVFYKSLRINALSALIRICKNLDRGGTSAASNGQGLRSAASGTGPRLEINAQSRPETGEPGIPASQRKRPGKREAREADNTHSPYSPSNQIFDTGAGLPSVQHSRSPQSKWNSAIVARS